MSVNKISEYDGGLLNHLETVYRPGDHELAVEFLEALGLSVTEIKFTKTSTKRLVAVHPNANDRDATNNVMYMYEMAPAQAELDAVIQKKIASDPELQGAMAKYRDIVRQTPGGTPHFGLRYTSAKALEPVLERLQTNLSPALRERVTVKEMPPYEAKEGMPSIRQVFVYTDVITGSPGGYGQLIELQVERGK
jgi:hypothetical protein